MSAGRHLTTAELEAGLSEIRCSPRDEGPLMMIVRRPRTLEREILERGELDVELGLIGDNWQARGSSMTDDGTAHPEMQINLMNARAIDLIAGDKSCWHLAGDQLFVDFDLSGENLPPGTRLAIGSAIIEVTAEPHTGCKKFVARFGLEAMKFVNSPMGRELNLRGINAKVVQGGGIATGDVVSAIGR
ncbi:MAG: MOSC domain-containing protein [Pirellulaceae bacterium]|nr:MOSC domain-containing protein [Pirellulaceae bacterium]